jgi:acyl-CoA synthetase (AMP-forming)/AMP-acid ligase II
MQTTTLANLLADPTSTEPAIIVEESGVAITYRALAEDVERLAEELRGAGLRAGDAVALVLPNGPELLVLFLALARAGLIAAPLNPAYKTDELRGLFADVEPRAIVAAVGNGVVADGAVGLAVPIWTASVGPLGAVRLAGIQSRHRGALEAPNAEDVALFLHTSGTEGRPKVVPLTHTNVVRAARHIASHYALTLADRTLVVMPLLHGHGLIGVAPGDARVRGGGNRSAPLLGLPLLGIVPPPRRELVLRRAHHL